MSELSIVLNGEPFELPKKISMVELFDILELSSKFMAVEVNNEIIFRDSWETFLISQGDKIELVRAIGGG